MGTRASQFIAIILTALALVPEGAHVLSLSVKVDMPEEPYLVVQQIYRGWAWLGIVIIAAILANLASALLARQHPTQLFLSLAASLLIAATLVVFSRGPIPPIKPPVTGRLRRTIGSSCGPSGSPRMP